MKLSTINIHKLFSDNSAFTLVELLVVVVVLGILVSIALPNFLTQVENSSDTAASANIRSAVSEILASYTVTGEKLANGTYAGTYWNTTLNTSESTVNGQACAASCNPSGSPFSDGNISCANTPWALSE